MTTAVRAERASPAEKLRQEFIGFSKTLELSTAARDACLDFLMEKTRQSWINGKEFGWKKAWNWKKGDRGAAAAEA